MTLKMKTLNRALISARKFLRDELGRATLLNNGLQQGRIRAIQ